MFFTVWRTRRLASIRLCFHTFLSFSLWNPFRTLLLTIKESASCWKMSITSYSCGDVFVSRFASCLCPCAYSSQFCYFFVHGWIWQLWRSLRWNWAQNRVLSQLYRLCWILSQSLRVKNLRLSIQNEMQLELAWKDVRKRKNFVHFSLLRSNMSSNATR